jgi:hypothetical protein
LDQFTNKNISDNLVVNWETLSKIEKEGFEIYEIGITETNEVKISSKIFQESLKYELIAIKKDSVIYSYFIEAFSRVKKDLYTGTIQDLDNYTGTLNVFNLQGKQLGQLLIHNGLPKNPSNKAELEFLQSAFNLFYKSNNKGLTSKVPECNKTYTVKLLTDQWEDRFVEWTYASTGEVYYTKYLGRVFIKTVDPHETMSVSYPCDSEYTNDDIHIPYITSNYRTFNCEISDVLEEKIDYSQLDPCPKAVMDELKTSTVCDIAEVLDKLGAGNIYTMNIKSEVAPSGAAAQTVKNSENNYPTYISTDYAGKTKLFIAASMFHEIVHAYFFSIVNDYNSHPNNNQNLYNLNSFPSLFQAYCDKKYPPAPGVSPNVHHLEIANYYVDAIARALQEFQTGNPVATGASQEQIYSDLAWGGLNRTPVFEATYPEGNPNRQRILNRAACEQNGTTKGAGTPNEQTPIGNPCN